MSNRKRMREGALSGVHVSTSRTKMAHERLDDLMENAFQSDGCRGLLVLGEPGTGKTHLIKAWLRAMKERDPEFRSVFSEVPPDCTLLGAVAQLLADCGDPDPEYGTIRVRTARVREAAAEQDVIVIDETQRLLKGKTASIGASVATWIANLLNMKLCPVILAGEPSAELLFEGNDYLERRFLGPVYVAPWDWNDPEERLEFRVFLDTMDRQTGLDKSGLGSPDTALRIWCFAGGRPGQTVRLLEEAMTVARRDGRTKLTADILATTVDRLRTVENRRLSNPFRVDDPTPESLPTEVDVPDPFVKRKGRTGR